MDKKLTIKDRKKAQPNAVFYFSEAEKKTIVDTVTKKLDVPQQNIFFYTCQSLGLNPLLNEIAAVLYHDSRTGNNTLSIQVMRDGFLTIAHRSGKFAGIESGVREENNKLIGWAKVYHKDFNQPVMQEADFAEYDNSARNALWKTKPKTMIKKVAESMALRKAFNINGVYAPEEMEKEISVAKNIADMPPLADGDEPATDAQLETLKAMGLGITEGMTKQQVAETIREVNSK